MSGTKKTKQWGRQNTLQITVEEWAIQLVLEKLAIHLRTIMPALSVQFSCSVVSNSITPWIGAHQASLSITNSQSSLKLMSIESLMPSSHLILCCPLLFLPSIPFSIRVFSNESTLRMRWPKYWSFSFSINPSKEIPGLISFGTAHYSLCKKQG